MATEEKKYLVNVEDNLDEYAKRAEEAGKEVEKLYEENLRLKNSSKATKEEIQKSDAALRVAKQGYKDAQKQVDLATKANKAQAGSYEQLYRQWQLAQTQLKLMGNAYTVNSKGVRVLSDEYIRQKQVVENAKRSLDDFGKGVADNRLNVGNYSEAVKGAVGELQMMPGVLGQATGMVQRFGKALLSLLANPIVLTIAAITAAFYALYKAIVSTDKGATELNVRMQQLRDTMDRVRQRLIDFVGIVKNAAGNVRDMVKEFINSHPVLIKTAKIIGLVVSPVVKLVAAGKKLVEVIKEKTHWFERLNTGAREYTESLDELADAETNYISQASKNKELIAELEYTAQDRSRSTEERTKALEEAVAISEMELKKQKQFRQERLDDEVDHYAQLYNITRESIIELLAADDIRAAQLMANDQNVFNFRNDLNDKLYGELEQLYADIIDLDTEFFKKQKENVSKLSGLREQFQKEEEERRKAEEERRLAAEAEAAVERLRQLNEEFVAEGKLKRIEAENINSELSTIDEEYRLRRAEATKLDYENGLRLLQQNLFAQYDLRIQALEQQRDAEIAYAESIGAETKDIAEYYNNQILTLERIKTEAKMQLASMFVNQLAQVFGEATAIGKAAAVAQTLIATYSSATKAFNSFADIPVVGTILGAAAAIAATAAGLLNVKKILAVKSGLPGEGKSAPRAIVGSSAAQKAYAPPVGTTSTLMPQLTQAETNALPNQQVVTAEDMVNAFKAVPPPVVTVEDINAKTESVRKVEVRATV